MATCEKGCIICQRDSADQEILRPNTELHLLSMMQNLPSGLAELQHRHPTVKIERELQPTIGFDTRPNRLRASGDCQPASDLFFVADDSRGKLVGRQAPESLTDRCISLLVQTHMIGIKNVHQACP